MLSCSLDDQRAAFEAGARYFVTKPYDPTTLLTAIQRAIAESCHV
jgi:CheY-like chemotaxis protein